MRQFVLAAGLIAAAAPALAVDLPARKAGAWEMTMDFHNASLPHQTMRQCTDADSDRLMNMNFAGSNEQACSKKDIVKSATGFTVDSICTFGGVTTTAHAVVTGSFDSAYAVDVTSSRKGGPAMPGRPAGGESHMSITAKWLGACKAGERPGDVTMPNGMTMNVLDMQKGRPPMPKR
ncbi:MAG TPA: DUF3617 family protein [Pseudolabrys sp.]|nr:DUF3617 family protein [Pseudolabrys sp.]